jgi:1,4-dihydroxy-2-naphthoyl-CoA hydrolase
MSVPAGGYQPMGFAEVLGLELDEVGPDRITGSFTVAPQLLQPYGILHGGALCAVVESAASVGAAVWFADRGRVVGVSNHTNFLRAVRAGTLHVEALPVHCGRTSQLWTVSIRDEQDKLVSQGEVRLANVTAEQLPPA